MRFGPPIRTNKLGELSKLRQTCTIGDYQRQFEQLSARASSLTSEQEVEIFITGLQEQIAIEVDIHHPKDLTTMGLARLYERRIGSPRQEPNCPKKCYNPTNTRPSITKQFSRSEMEEQRSRGLCFNCEELFVPGHRCERLFRLEVVEDSDLEEEADKSNSDDPGISLHAITGISHAQTMQITGYIHSMPFRVLIDSGSTHCFLDTNLASQLNLEITQRGDISVKVAMGNTYHVRKCVRPFRYS